MKRRVQFGVSPRWIVLLVATLGIAWLSPVSATDWRTSNRQRRNDQRTYNRHQRIRKRTNNYLNGLRDRRNGSYYRPGAKGNTAEKRRRRAYVGANNCNWLKRLAARPRVDFMALQSALGPAMVGWVQSRWNGTRLRDRVVAYGSLCGFSKQQANRLYHAADYRPRRRNRGPKRCYRVKVVRISHRATRTSKVFVPCPPGQRGGVVRGGTIARRGQRKRTLIRTSPDQRRKEAEVARALAAASGATGATARPRPATAKVQAWRQAYKRAHGRYPPAGMKPPK